MAKSSTRAPLTDNVEQLHTLVYELEDQVSLLKEQLLLAVNRQFGHKADHIDVDQIPLFASDDTELVTVDDAPLSIPVVQAPQQSDKQFESKHLRILKSIPVVREEIVLPATQRECECCGTELKDIGTDVQWQIEYQPASLIKKEFHRHKYTCRKCEQSIVRAPAKAVPIPKSPASPSLLAYLIVSKFADHLPLYRIDKRLARLGLSLPRHTQGDWLGKCGDLLAPLVKVMQEDVLERGHVYTDDTILPLQNDEPERKRAIQARMWVYRTDHQHGPPIVTYDFSRSRSKSAPAEILKNYKGFLQADAYTGYDHLYESGDINEVACWAHTRRKFVEAAKLTKKATRAHQAVARINALYRLERQWKPVAESEKQALRQSHSQPLLLELKSRLENQLDAALPKSALGQAIRYALKNWTALFRYSTTGHLNIDNNLAEQAMRPIALGRKNFLFVGSENAGRHAAVLYSLVETCKVNHINPLSYLTDLLEVLPKLGRHPSDEELKILLPYTNSNLETYRLA